MNRQEAVDLLKEISDTCGSLREQGIALMPPDADSVLSHGYQLHIFAEVSEESIVCLKEVIKKRKLQLNLVQEKNLLVIYRPMKASLQTKQYGNANNE